jgi:hypothetical protein
MAKVARGEQPGEAEGFEATAFALAFSPTGATYRSSARTRGSPLWVELNVPDGLFSPNQSAARARPPA